MTELLATSKWTLKTTTFGELELFNAVGVRYFIRVMLFDSANADQPRSVVIRNDEVDGQRQTPSTGCLDFSESAAIELVKGHDSKESSERIIGRKFHS